MTKSGKCFLVTMKDIILFEKLFKNLLTNRHLSAIIKIEKREGEIQMNKLNITINFDMDGTIADLYGVDNWLEMLIAEDTTPLRRS